MTGLPGIEGGRLTNRAPLRRRALRLALEALNGDGAETRIVGGAVRDLVLGVEPSDFDLATTALPEETIARARAAGFKVVPTGIEHGTVTLIMDGRTIETTTLRQDVETDGRYAKVAFGRDFLADACRRDFTINALSLDAAGRVFDPLGGLDDLAAGRVRFIGDADARIREDTLRILRFFRFSARFGNGALDPVGLGAAIRARAGLARLSRERVGAEFMKLLVAPHVCVAAQAMAEAGILAEALGFAAPARLARAVAIETAAGSAPDAVLRLAALAVLVEEDGARCTERLRLSNAEGERLARAAATLATLHGLEAAPPDADLLRLLFVRGRRAASDALLLAQAGSLAAPDEPGFARAQAFLVATPAPKSPLTGASLLARGVAPGPRVGRILRAFERLWAEAGFPTDAAAVERLLGAAEAPDAIV